MQIHQLELLAKQFNQRSTIDPNLLQQLLNTPLTQMQSIYFCANIS